MTRVLDVPPMILRNIAPLAIIVVLIAVGLHFVPFMVNNVTSFIGVTTGGGPIQR